MFAHQVGVGRLDEDFDLDRVLVLGKTVALHPTDLNLFVEHWAVTIERTEPLSFEDQV
ncbi:hypothetical protein D3C71_2240120 [compost metagenome]